MLTLPTETDNWLEPSDDVLREHAYLVARGVRPLGLIGHCAPTTKRMEGIMRRLASSAVPGTVPFCLRHDDLAADYGYAAAQWAVDLYEWVIGDDAVTPEQRHRIIGLLLGYSVQAISAFTVAE